MPIDLAVIPVAGKGTRLLPLTKSQPKEMLAVGSRPVVQYVVEELAQAEINKICFVTGPGKHSIENHFDVDAELIRNLREEGKEELLGELDFERRSMEYYYTRQRRHLGNGHAILQAKSFVGDQSFVVAFGDSIIGLHAKSTIVRTLADAFESAGADAAIAFERVPRADVVHYGIAEPRDPEAVHGDGPFDLTGIVEKPSVEDAASDLAVAARYVFSPEIFSILEETQPGKGGEIQITDAIQTLIGNGGKVIGLALGEGEKRYDIGNPLSYFRAFIDFALGDPEYGETLTREVREKISDGSH
jgi:UTP--glucose-1-phosphate uridylyltransferase